MTAGPHPGKRIAEIDGIRGVAICMVVLWHWVHDTTHPTPDTGAYYAIATMRCLWVGLDMFFVMSGFLVGGVLLDAKGNEKYLQTFFARRFFRTLPLYTLWFALFAVGLALAPQDGSLGHVFNASIPVWSYASFTQNFWHAARQVSGPDWLTPTWSLALEEQFYLVMPFAVLFLCDRRLKAVCLAGVVIAPLLRSIALVLGHNVFAASYLLPCRMDSLGIGVLLALIVRDPKAMRLVNEHRGWYRMVFAVLAVGTLAITTIPSEVWTPDNWKQEWVLRGPGYTWVAMFCASLLLMVWNDAPTAARRIFGNALARRVGVIAYGVYIMHQGINDLLHWAVFHRPALHDGREAWLVTAASAVATYVLASVSWKYFESPLINHAYRRYPNKRPVAAMAQAS